jgi:hypothetical protein
MNDLIKALQIFLKYGDPKWPTHCEHDVLTVTCDPAVVSEEDLKTLDELGFFPDNDGHFMSYRFGSA